MRLLDIVPTPSPILAVFGAIGAGIASAYGGWDTGMTLLVICMGVDYVSGLIVAGVFKESRKSKNGALESRAGWKGLGRKVMTLFMVLIAAWMDKLIGVSWIRDAVCIAYTANELISIVENAGLMGLPIPAVMIKAIDILRDHRDSVQSGGDKQ